MAQPRESSRETTQEADSRHDSTISQEDGDSNDSLKMTRASDSSTAKKQRLLEQEPVAQPTHIANAGEEQQALAKDKLYQWWYEGNTDAPLKMARAEQAIAKKQTETPEFKRFFGDWDAAAKVKRVDSSPAIKIMPHIINLQPGSEPGFLLCEKSSRECREGSYPALRLNELLDVGNR